MAGPISIGDEAPNFDLTSTEGVILMLCDEVVRSAVVLYFFEDPESDRCRRDLAALADRRDALAELDTKILAVAPIKAPALRELQGELDLPFPLLCDDRGFAASYGVVATEEGEPAAPALVVVDRKQVVRLLSNPVASAAETLSEAERLLGGLPAPTARYPRSVVNRVVDRWVN